MTETSIGEFLLEVSGCRSTMRMSPKLRLQLLIRGRFQRLKWVRYCNVESDLEFCNSDCAKNRRHTPQFNTKHYRCFVECLRRHSRINTPHL